MILGLATFGGCGKPLSMPPRPEPTVTVSRPIERMEGDYQVYTGEAKSVESVEIRARVTGYLVEVKFRDGDIVDKDQQLYQIDPRPFEATLEQMKGRLEALNAAKRLLQIQVDRYKTLVASNAASQQELDEYLAKQAENVGELKSAEANVRQAQLNLDFTRVTSPIRGKISRTQWTQGNLVTADQTLLTTVMSYDPIYGYFNVDEPTILRLQKMVRDGVFPVKDTRSIKIRMGLVDDIDRKFPIAGEVDFVNNAVDPQTGTILARGKFDNPLLGTGVPPLITPGDFVRVRVPTGMPQKMLLIAERAIGNDQGKKFVYVVDASNKVHYRPVKLGLKFHGLQAVSGEVKAGERVVVGGLQRIRPDAVVKVEEVNMIDLAEPGAAEGLKAEMAKGKDPVPTPKPEEPKKPEKPGP